MASHNKVSGLGLVAKLSEKDNALQRSERKFSLAFKAAADVIMITRAVDGEVIDINEAFTRLIGFSRDEAVGKTTIQIGLWKNSRDRLAVLSQLEAGGVVHNLETTLKMKSNDVRVGLLTMEIVEYDGERCIVASWHDITERKNAEEQLKRQNEYLSLLHQALQEELIQRKAVELELRYINAHDSLTKLYNRGRFEDELKRQAKDSAAIIICDVDGLKLINDSMGHQQGDALLVAAAEIIRQAAPAHAFTARIGGDEFAVILSDLDKTQADAQAELVCQTIRQLAEDRSQREPHLPLSISTGYAVSLGDSMAQLFKAADDSMYREKLHRSQSVRSAIVQALLKALEARDFVTEGHGERMQSLVTGLGEAAGLAKRTLSELRLIAQFHDIGKVGIPDRILFKPGSLTPDEYAEMKRHCEIGHRIALAAPDLAPIAKYILHHHEWWNGQGYPIGLNGSEIPLECRIVAIADAYDAMTSNRPYRQAMEHDQAIAELKRCAGKQFDPWLVAFVESCKSFTDAIGSTCINDT